MPGYRGFPSRKAYEDHYSDPAKYAAEIPAMEEYAREAEAERSATEWSKLQTQNATMRAALEALDAVLDFSDPAEACACFRDPHSFNEACEKARLALES